MGSRIRENPDKVFEVFVEIARPTGGEEPFILQQFPPEYDDKAVLSPLPRFAFPCETDSNVVDHFTFVLTDIDSKFKFGFCRHGTTGAQTCLCIISHLPWYEIFYKLLNELAEILNRSENDQVENLLRAVYELTTPQPLEPVEVVTKNLTDKFSFVTPDPSQLASIPENRNLTEYYNATDSTNMMIILASMLYERRILVTSRKLSRLTACIHASSALLYPMSWQHLYIPVLPPHLLDYCSAPMPYLIGIHSTLMERVEKSQELGDAVIFDVDKDEVRSEYDDLETLPPEVLSILKKRLKSGQSEKARLNLLGDGVSRVFLRALVALIGGYRDALKFRPGEMIKFDHEAFIQSRPPSMQPFLENMLHLQIFEQFINERLDLLNAGEGFSDEFEVEVNTYVDKTSTIKYREWVTSMKKQGKKLKREGKDKWEMFTSRVRDRSKRAYQDIKTKLRKDEDGSPVRHDGIPLPGSDIRRVRLEMEDEDSERTPPLRRITAPAMMSKPPRPPPPSFENRLSVSPRSSLLRKQSENAMLRDLMKKHESSGTSLRVSGGSVGTAIRGKQYHVLTMEDINTDDAARKKRIASDDSEVSDMTYERISIGLMDDPEIQQVFKRSFSLEDVTRLQEEIEEEGTEALMLIDSSRSRLHPKDEVKSTSSSPIPRPRPLTPGNLSQHSGDVQPLPAPEPVVKKHSDILVNKLRSDSINLMDFSGSSPSREVSGVTKMKSKLDAQSEEGGVQMRPHRQMKDFDPFVASSKNSQSQESLQSNISSSSQRSTGDEDSEISDQGRRPSLTRHNAFYNGQRPNSVRRVGSSSIRDARKAFMESEARQPSLNASCDLEQFDPLLTGQLAVDEKTPSPRGSNQSINSASSSHEDNLLKEWNLDFSKKRVTPTKVAPPPIPPKPNLSSTDLKNYTSQSSFDAAKAAVASIYAGPLPAVQTAPPMHTGPLPPAASRPMSYHGQSPYFNYNYPYSMNPMVGNVAYVPQPYRSPQTTTMPIGMSSSSAKPTSVNHLQRQQTLSTNQKQFTAAPTINNNIQKDPFSLNELDVNNLSTSQPARVPSPNALQLQQQQQHLLQQQQQQKQQQQQQKRATTWEVFE